MTVHLLPAHRHYFQVMVDSRYGLAHHLSFLISIYALRTARKWEENLEEAEGSSRFSYVQSKTSLKRTQLLDGAFNTQVMDLVAGALTCSLAHDDHMRLLLELFCV